MARRAQGGSEDKAFLNADQIMERVIGKTLNFRAPSSGENLFVYFSPDGAVELKAANAEDEPQVKKWFINDNDMLCRTFGPKDKNHCTRIAPTDGPDRLVMTNKKVRYGAKILEGRSLPD